MTLREVYRPIPKELDCHAAQGAARNDKQWSDSPGIRRALGQNDNTILRATERLERFFDSRGLKWTIWAVLAFAVIYFSPVIFNIFNR